jgi:hypothetical protein
MKIKTTIIAALLMMSVGCSYIPENIKLGVTKLDAASKLMSVHNKAHCEAKIAELQAKLATMPDGPERQAVLSELANEKEYLEANILLPEATEELRKWAFEESLEE